jgi:hypothetical protein
MDLQAGREARATVTEAHVAHQQFDQPLDLGFISGQQLQLVRTMKQ